MKAKRSRALVLALVVFLSAVLPVKQSFAFAPLALAGAAFTTGSGATLSVFAPVAGQTAGYIAAGFAGALGLTLGYMTIKDAADNAIKIPVGPNASNAPPVPEAPASAATISSGGKPANSATVQAAWCTTDYPAGCGTVTSLDVCLSNYQGGYAGRYCKITTANDPNFGSTYGTNCAGCTSANPVTSCPSGYTISGGNCTLTNARQVTDDKSCDLLVTMGQFATAADRNCSSTADGSKLSPLLRDGKVLAYGTNSNGQPLLFQVEPGAQSYKVTAYEQIQTGTQTVVQKTVATVDAATSQVTSVQTTSSPGTISSPATSSVPTVTDGTTPTSSTNTPTVSTTDAQPIVFPSDYARAGEAQNAAKSIQDAVANTVDLGDPDTPGYTDPWGSTFTALKGWTLPGHSSACPVGSFTWNNSIYSINSHCALIGDHWGALQAAMTVVWVVLGLVVILGA